jgi:hypothetical protein
MKVYMTWQMYPFSDLQQQAVPEQLLMFSAAYLDSSEVLCEKLCSGVTNANYAHGAAIMSLAFHSVELFLKACILKREPNEQFGGKNGHDLDALSKRYSKLYPKQEFQFEIPFRRNTPIVKGMAAEEFAELLAYAQEHNMKISEDQRHRYPTRIDGKTWDGDFAFEPNLFLATLLELQNAYTRIRIMADKN